MSEETTGSESGMGVNIDAVVSFTTKPGTIENRTKEAMKHGLDQALNDLDADYTQIREILRLFETFSKEASGKGSQKIKANTDIKALGSLSKQFDASRNMSGKTPTSRLNKVDPSADMIAKALTYLEQASGQISPKQVIKLGNGSEVKFGDLHDRFKQASTSISTRVLDIGKQLDMQMKSIPVLPKVRFDNKFITNRNKLPHPPGMVVDFETANTKGTRSDIWTMGLHTPQGGLKSVQRNLQAEGIQIDAFNQSFAQGTSLNKGTNLVGMLKAFHHNYMKTVGGDLNQLSLEPIHGWGIKAADSPWLTNAIDQYSQRADSDPKLLKDLQIISKRAPVNDVMEQFATFVRKDIGYTYHDTGKMGLGNKLENAAAMFNLPYGGHDAAGDAATTTALLQMFNSAEGRELAKKTANVDAWKASITKTSTESALSKYVADRDDGVLPHDIVKQYQTRGSVEGYQEEIVQAQMDGIADVSKYFDKLGKPEDVVRLQNQDKKVMVDSVIANHQKASTKIAELFGNALHPTKKHGDKPVSKDQIVDNLINSPDVQNLINDVVGTYRLTGDDKTAAATEIEGSLRSAANLSPGTGKPISNTEAAKEVAARISRASKIQQEKGRRLDPREEDRIRHEYAQELHTLTDRTLTKELIDGSIASVTREHANVEPVILPDQQIQAGNIRGTQLGDLADGVFDNAELARQFREGGTQKPIPKGAEVYGKRVEELVIDHIKKNLSDRFDILEGEAGLTRGPTSGTPDAWLMHKDLGNLPGLAEIKSRSPKEMNKMYTDQGVEVPGRFEAQTHMYGLQAGLEEGTPITYFLANLDAREAEEAKTLQSRIQETKDPAHRKKLEQDYDEMIRTMPAEKMGLGELHEITVPFSAEKANQVIGSLQRATDENILNYAGKIPEAVIDFVSNSVLKDVNIDQRLDGEKEGFTSLPVKLTEEQVRKKFALGAEELGGGKTNVLKHRGYTKEEVAELAIFDGQAGQPPRKGGGGGGGTGGGGGRDDQLPPDFDRSITASSEQSLSWVRDKYKSTVKRFTVLNELEKGFGRELERLDTLPDLDSAYKSQLKDQISLQREKAARGKELAANEAHALKTQIGFAEMREVKPDLTSSEFLADQALQTQQARIAKAQAQAIQGAVGIELDGFDYSTFSKAIGPAIQLQKLGGEPAGISATKLMSMASKEGLFTTAPKDLPSVFDGLSAGMSTRDLMGKEKTVEQDLGYFKSAEASVEKLFGALQKSTGQTFLTPAAEEAQQFIKASEEALAIADQLKVKADLERSMSEAYAEQGVPVMAGQYKWKAGKTEEQIKAQQDEALRNAQIAQARVKAMEPDLTSQDTQRRIFEQNLIKKEQQDLQNIASIRGQASYYSDPKNQDAIHASLGKEITLQREALQLEQARLNILVQRSGASLKDFQKLHGVNQSLRRDHGVTGTGMGNTDLIRLGEERGFAGVDIAGGGGRQKDFVSSTIGLIDWQLQWMAGMAVLGSVSSFFKNSFGFAVQYEAAMKGIQLVTQANVQDMKLLEAEVARLATTFHYSASELGQGLTILGKAGYTAVESLKIIPSIAALATATMSTLKIAADVTTTAVEAYHLTPDEVPDLSNVLASMTVESKLDLEKLGTTFNYVAASAASAGISIEETGTAMGLMANSGIRASTIGTSLRSIMGSLMAPTAKFQKELANVGMSIDEVNPLTNRLSEILLKLQRSGFDVESAFAGLDKRIAGGVNTLVHTAHLWDDFESRITGTNRAFEMAEGHMDTLEAQTKRLANAFQLLGRDLFKGNLEGLKATTGVLTGLINTIGKGSEAVPDIVKSTAASTLAFTTMMSIGAGVGSGIRGRYRSIKSKKDTALRQATNTKERENWHDTLSGQDMMIYSTISTLFSPKMLGAAALMAVTMTALSAAYKDLSGHSSMTASIDLSAKLETENSALKEAIRLYNSAAAGTHKFRLAQKELMDLGITDFSPLGLRTAKQASDITAASAKRLAADSVVRHDQSGYRRFADNFTTREETELAKKGRTANVEAALRQRNIFYSGDEVAFAQYFDEYDIPDYSRQEVIASRRTVEQEENYGKMALAEAGRRFMLVSSTYDAGAHAAEVAAKKAAEDRAKTGAISIMQYDDAGLPMDEGHYTAVKPVPKMLEFGPTFGMGKLVNWGLQALPSAKKAASQEALAEDLAQQVATARETLIAEAKELELFDLRYGEQKTRTGAQLQADRRVIDAGDEFERLRAEIQFEAESTKPQEAKDIRVKFLQEQLDAAEQVLIQTTRQRMERSGLLDTLPENLVGFAKNLIPLITTVAEDGDLDVSPKGLDLLSKVAPSMLKELTDRLGDIATKKGVELSNLPEQFKTAEVVYRINLKYELEAQELTQKMIDEAAAKANTYFTKLRDTIRVESDNTISRLESQGAVSAAFRDARLSAIDIEMLLPSGSYTPLGMSPDKLPSSNYANKIVLEQRKADIEAKGREEQRMLDMVIFYQKRSQLEQEAAAEAARLLATGQSAEKRLESELAYHDKFKKLLTDRQKQVIDYIKQEEKARLDLVNKIVALEKRRADVSKQFSDAVTAGQEKINPSAQRSAGWSIREGAAAIQSANRFRRIGKDELADNEFKKGMDLLTSVTTGENSTNQEIARAISVLQQLQLDTDMVFKAQKVSYQQALIPVVEKLEEIRVLLGKEPDLDLPVKKPQHEGKGYITQEGKTLTLGPQETPNYGSDWRMSGQITKDGETWSLTSPIPQDSIQKQLETRRAAEEASRLELKSLYEFQDSDYFKAHSRIPGDFDLAPPGTRTQEDIDMLMEAGVTAQLQRVVDAVGTNLENFTSAVNSVTDQMMQTYRKLKEEDDFKKNEEEKNKPQAAVPKMDVHLISDINVIGTDNLVAVTAKSAAKIVEEELTNGLRS